MISDHFLSISLARVPSTVVHLCVLTDRLIALFLSVHNANERADGCKNPLNVKSVRGRHTFRDEKYFEFL
jgi:hypothetical protein